MDGHEVVEPSGGARPGEPQPDRRRVLAAGAAGIVTISLPPASAAATNIEPLASPAALTFTDVTTTGFTVSWA